MPFVPNMPLVALVVWPVLGIVVLVLIRGVRASCPGLSALPEVVASLLLGGGLANALEAQLFGSVTDFLGIHLSGIYSAGDIAMNIGSSLLPIAVVQVAQAQNRSRRRVLQIGTIFFLAVVLVGVVTQNYALAVLVTLVTAASVAISLGKPAILPGTAPPMTVL